jgi:N-acyl-D-aspartate/D-glutamate deacylase
MVRQTTVMYKESSHLIREWGWDGDLLKGIVETLPYTPNGKSLSGLILDKVTVGFSLRGLADLEDRGEFQDVLDPLIVIAFDSVSEPSHVKATIQEIRNENVVHILSESNQLICCSNGHCYLPNYFDYLIETEILKLQKYI